MSSFEFPYPVCFYEMYRPAVSKRFNKKRAKK